MRCLVTQFLAIVRGEIRDQQAAAITEQPRGFCA